MDANKKDISEAEEKILDMFFELVPTEKSNIGKMNREKEMLTKASLRCLMVYKKIKLLDIASIERAILLSEQELSEVKEFKNTMLSKIFCS